MLSRREITLVAGNCTWVGAAHQRRYIGAAESVLGNAGKCRNAVKDNTMFPPEIFAVKHGIPVNRVPLKRGSTCRMEFFALLKKCTDWC